MNTTRIKQIQRETAYPDSVSVQQALIKVWNECMQEAPYPEILRLRAIETRIRDRIDFLNADLEYLRKRFGDNPRNRLTIAVNQILVAELEEMLGK